MKPFSLIMNSIIREMLGFLFDGMENSNNKQLVLHPNSINQSNNSLSNIDFLSMVQSIRNE